MTATMPDGALHVASRRVVEGPELAVHDPWSGAELARVVLADAARAEEAVVASVRAVEVLRACTSYERKVVLAQIAREIEAQERSFAELIARESGSPSPWPAPRCPGR